MRDEAEVETVVAICERIGFGRVMQIAADAWRARDPIGALTVGPCVGPSEQAALRTGPSRDTVDWGDTREKS